MNGTIQDIDDPAVGNTAAQNASASLGIAIADARGRKCPTGQAIPCLLTRAELGGSTLTPGLYTFSGVATITGTLHLSGAGVYIFQLGALTVNPGGAVALAVGATAANVFWVTTQTTLNSERAFAGTILSSAGITFTASAGDTALTGRALSQTNVTFIDDTVTLPPNCTENVSTKVWTCTP